MTTFFTIFFVLIVINAALLTFSVITNNRKQAEISGERSAATKEKVYPLDLSTSQYRKAI
jgi:hypothetical protein